MNDEREAESELVPAPDSEDTATDGSEDTPAEIQDLEQLQARVIELKNQVLRERAEAENVRKRAERDVAAAHKYGLERLVQELLPVKDSMDLGLDAALDATEIKPLAEGVALTAKMFGDFFDKLHIRPVDPAGERFDPEFHQAVTTEEASDVEPGTVLRVMQKGYVLNDRLVRPALVIVARAPASGGA